MNYYYLVASLPALSLNNPPPFTPDGFQSICREHLSNKDMKALESLLSDDHNPDPLSDFIREWQDMETQIRNAAARIRAGKLKKDVTPYLKDQNEFDGYIDKLVSDAFSKANPADRELTLDKFRWEQIEEMAGHDVFSGKAILAYTLKLLLAERWAAMEKENGRKNVDDIINKKPEDEDDNKENA
ncbi:DUF2764 family protein [Verrucomicrobiota bacterium]